MKTNDIIEEAWERANELFERMPDRIGARDFGVGSYLILITGVMLVIVDRLDQIAGQVEERE